VDYPRGHPKNPMTDAEIEEKFIALSARVLTKRRIRRVLDRLWGMEKIKDTGEVLSLFLSIKRRPI